MKTIKFFTCTFLAMSLLITSCSGEDGEDGMDGADGSIGLTGEDGTDGEDGNANVTSILFDSFSTTTGINTFEISEITQDIVDNGLVLGYAQVPGSPLWETLPIFSGGILFVTIQRISLGEAETNFNSTTPTTLNYRFLILEGATSRRSSQQSGEDLKSYYEDQWVDFSDYESVAEYFNLD